MKNLWHQMLSFGYLGRLVLIKAMWVGWRAGRLGMPGSA